MHSMRNLLISNLLNKQRKHERHIVHLRTAQPTASYILISTDT